MDDNKFKLLSCSRFIPEEAPNKKFRKDYFEVYQEIKDSLECNLKRENPNMIVWSFEQLSPPNKDGMKMIVRSLKKVPSDAMDRVIYNEAYCNEFRLTYEMNVQPGASEIIIRVYKTGTAQHMKTGWLSSILWLVLLCACVGVLTFLCMLIIRNLGLALSYNGLSWM